ncbi:MAG TPA: hypothetical protein VL181_10430 [Holophagaceae bacterium]|nr:hypothetical protein [Holophagaceae bacterium]
MTLGRRRHRSLLWMENHRLVAGPHRRTLQGPPIEDDLAQALAAQPEGPAVWVVDDLWAPALLARDIAELPSGGEARDAFFRWRFQQAFGTETPWSVQAAQLEDGPWLLNGMPEATRDAWVALAQHLNHPIASLQPRWLWLFNRLAPALDAPGMLLSLSRAGNGKYAGTLAAWGRGLCLLRQWEEALAPEAWNEERLAPSSAFLQRESKSPQSVHIWGVEGPWPQMGLPVHRLDDSLLAEAEEVA